MDGTNEEELTETREGRNTPPVEKNEPSGNETGGQKEEEEASLKNGENGSAQVMDERDEEKTKERDEENGQEGRENGSKEEEKTNGEENNEKESKGDEGLNETETNDNQEDEREDTGVTVNDAEINGGSEEVAESNGSVAQPESDAIPVQDKESTPTNEEQSTENGDKEATPTRDDESSPGDEDQRETTPTEEDGVARRPEVRTVRFSEDVERIEISSDSSDHRELVQVEISGDQEVREVCVFL